jgi:hypothetical protein
MMIGTTNVWPAETVVKYDADPETADDVPNDAELDGAIVDI